VLYGFSNSKCSTRNNQKPVEFEVFQKVIEVVGCYWMAVNEPPTVGGA
jgi:hypothetical protein